VSVAALANTWADVVSRLMAPVLRALEPDLRLGADWVWAQLPRWRADEGSPHGGERSAGDLSHGSLDA
jgi:hypothetical protein